MGNLNDNNLYTNQENTWAAQGLSLYIDNLNVAIFANLVK